VTWIFGSEPVYFWRAVIGCPTASVAVNGTQKTARTGRCRRSDHVSAGRVVVNCNFLVWKNVADKYLLACGVYRPTDNRRKRGRICHVASSV
jgi:hypothetical protein